MSYARFGAPPESQVYVFLTCPVADYPTGALECCGCWLVGDAVYARFTTTEGMLDHLAEHRAAGHGVADSTLDALRADAAVNDEWIRTGIQPADV